jgi:hypothetical protein
MAKRKIDRAVHEKLCHTPLYPGSPRPFAIAAIRRFLFGLANGMVPLSHRQYINTWPLGFEVISRVGLFPARQVIRASRD